MLRRHPVRGRSGCVIAQPLVLVEQLHHVFHSLQRIFKPLRPFLRGAASKTGKNLLCGYRQEHPIQHNVRCADDAVLLLIFPIHFVAFARCFVNLFMERLLARRMLLQLFHIGKNQSLSF